MRNFTAQKGILPLLADSSAALRLRRLGKRRFLRFFPGAARGPAGGSGGSFIFFAVASHDIDEIVQAAYLFFALVHRVQHIFPKLPQKKQFISRGGADKQTARPFYRFTVVTEVAKRLLNILLVHNITPNIAPLPCIYSIMRTYICF